MIKTSLTLLVAISVWSVAGTAKSPAPEVLSDTASVSECHVYAYTRDNVFLRSRPRRASSNCHFIEQPRRPV